MQVSLCVAEDENGLCSPVAAQELDCLRILPKINDISWFKMPAQKEQCNDTSDDHDTGLHEVRNGCDVEIRQNCHTQDAQSHSDANAAVNNPPEQKLLPSCSANWVDPGGVAAADVCTSDDPPRGKLLPFLCDRDHAKDGCDSPADICDADSQPHGKLLPSLSSADV